MTGSRDEIRYGSMDATFDDFAPPTGNLYPTMPSVSHSAQNNGTLMPLGSSETVDLSEPIPTQVTSPTSSPFRISVTSPVKELLHSKMPGVQEVYYTYLVNMSTTLTTFTNSEISVRRRFRDFVDLSKLLMENYRGFFVPPRPHRNMYQGKIRMSPTFIEQRRKSLEKYIKQLTMHPVISRSEELRVFLEARGPLRECMAWVQLHPASPPWYESAMKLMRQVTGQERAVPTALEVTQPINPKRDILRSMKEGMKSFKEKRAPSIRGGKEAALRNETEIMQEFKKTVDDAWKWASYWIDRVELLGSCHESLADALNGLHNFETHSHGVSLDAPESIARGCSRSASVHRQLVNQSANPLSYLHDYTELVVAVLKALSAREDALNTVKTLQGDLATKRAKLNMLETTPGRHQQATTVQSDIAALEASIQAAQSTYDRVSAHNTQEMSRLRTQRELDFGDMLRGIAKSQVNFSSHMCEVWCQVAEDLGADPAAISALKSQY